MSGGRVHSHDYHATDDRIRCWLCNVNYPKDKYVTENFRICKVCGYKALVLLIVIMIALTYVVWFGIY